MDKYEHLKQIKLGISQIHKINESIKDTENPLPLSMIEPNSEQKIKNMTVKNQTLHFKSVSILFDLTVCLHRNIC